MDVVYKNIQGYKGIKVRRLIPGSVVVDHVVIISLMMTTQSQEKLQNITMNLREEIHAAVEQQNCTNGELCFNSSHVVFGNSSLNFDEEAYCKQQVAEDYRDYYFPNLTSSGFNCISNCTPDTSGTINCNKGQCKLTQSGPQCFCNETDIYWYQDNRCKTRVSKMVVGFSLAVAILAITVIVLAIFLFRAQRTRTFYSTQKAMKQRWYEDMDEAWTLPGSFTFRNQDAQLEDKFQVDLDSVDTSATG
ncbi:flocculation protein FLO11-like [Grus japonensis]|uniref:Flocculation protein FLO11-like n=1 Tax=Grus japonensis TaxID=30415 RepID=A0ABC9XU21_GRUJA